MLDRSINSLEKKDKIGREKEITRKKMKGVLGKKSDRK